VINVMDLRKGDQFYPFHADLARHLSEPSLGGRLKYDDLFVWDRRSEYNCLRPFGYPSVFRINKIHESLPVFQRPHGPAAAPGTRLKIVQTKRTGRRH
jgi:hypothetical protein